MPKTSSDAKTISFSRHGPKVWKLFAIIQNHYFNQTDTLSGRTRDKLPEFEAWIKTDSLLI